MLYVDIPNKTIQENCPQLYLEFLMQLKINNLTLSDFAYLISKVENNRIENVYDKLSNSTYLALYSIYSKIVREFKKKTKVKIKLDISAINSQDIPILTGSQNSRYMLFKRDVKYHKILPGKSIQWEQNGAPWVAEVEISSRLKQLKGSLIISDY